MRGSWDEDGVDGGPSSMELLLEWLSMPGNASRWRKAAGNGRKRETRTDLIDEIHDLLLSYGIKHRTSGSIWGRIYLLECELEKAQSWLKAKGVRDYDDSRETEDAVLKLCPYYPAISPLLLLPPPRSTPQRARNNVYRNDTYCSDDDKAAVFHSSSEDEEELPKLGFKRTRVSPHERYLDDGIKRARVEENSHGIKLEDTKSSTVLVSELDERREMFKLELQVKRDEALVVRAKARKELRDAGVPFATIERLLPLEMP
ncbi:hypothetical protein P3T76_006842 [Phytophthora citrophthora]|uniref:Uncharacterized protein n=1 Tax=Phytophthora citrophthora TaxID=4793 RepID=A0AAD9GP94_9STRA|nr:hypothetical protein P3T76_006842 [Phytophthora citrophthora]